LIQTILEKIDRHAAVVFLIEDILTILVVHIESILQTAALRISRRHRFVAALQYFILLLWANWKEIATSQLPIHVAASATLETTHCHIPVAPGCHSLLLIEIDTPLIQVSALGPPDGGRIPIAAGQKLRALFLNGVYQYHVAGANQTGSKYGVASQRFTYYGQGPIHEASLLVEISTETQKETWFGHNTEI
jgi:hypothetical protein